MYSLLSLAETSAYCIFAVQYATLALQYCLNNTKQQEYSSQLAMPVACASNKANLAFISFITSLHQHYTCQLMPTLLSDNIAWILAPSKWYEASVALAQRVQC